MASSDAPYPERERCYVASPLGFTEAGRAYNQTVFLPALAAVVEPIDPWSLVSASAFASATSVDERRELAASVGRRNIAAIRSCAVLAAYLDGQEVDSGTAAEVGYAAALGIRCVGMRSDLRVMGELDTAVNLQVEAFIIESGGTVVGSLAELADELARSRPEVQDI